MQLNERMITAIMAATPHGLRGCAVSGLAVKQGKYKALDVYLEQIPTMQGMVCQLVVANNNRIL